MAGMRRPQFSLFSILSLLTISCAICALQPAAAQYFRFRDMVITMGLDPPTLGAPFLETIGGLDIPLDPGSWQAFWIRATIAAALAMVGLSWTTLLSGVNAPRRQKIARWAWTLGFAFYLAHVGCAFAFVHHWSHVDATWHTVLRTYELTGWLWPGGIWINYFFTLLWGADVIYWWSRLDRYDGRPARLRWFVHAFFVFMIFQAGVVFASGATRWATLAGLSMVALFGLLRLNRSRGLASP